jgi:hypothetical protein
VGNKTYLTIGMTIASILVGGWKSAIPGLDLAGAANGGGSGAGPLAALTSFSQATAALSAQQTATGSYVGAVLPAGSVAQFAWVTAEQYCLQTRDLHLVGPLGVPQPGLCPAG